MDFYSYKNDELYCEDVKISKLASGFGTPLYIYSLTTLVRHFEVIRRAFGNKNHLICYSAKANTNIAVLKAINLLGGGVDVVSGGELRIAIKAGVNPRKTVFSGVGKSDDEIKLALESGILFISAESLQELESIARIAGKLKTVADVAVRVNPDIDPRTHPHIATGLKNTKFGLGESEAKKAYHYIETNKWLNAVGISMHIGSQVAYVEPYIDSVKKIIGLYRYLQKRNLPLKYIDIGGGWAAYFRPGDRIPLPADYITALSGLLKNLDSTVIVEPGRSLIGNAGALVMRVIAVKKSGRKSFCIVDAGMNDFIRPVLYNANHRIVPVRKNELEKITYDVVGPLCESGDYLSKGLKMSVVERGDYLVLHTAGAYGFSMASNYNSRPRPAEILVAGEKAIVMRDRESINDIIRNQKSAGITSGIINDIKHKIKF